MTTVLDELAELVWSRPGPAAPAGEVAAWYERKATMLAHAAAAGDLDTSRATRWARQAHDHATHLAKPSCRDASRPAGSDGSRRWAA